MATLSESAGSSGASASLKSAQMTAIHRMLAFNDPNAAALDAETSSEYKLPVAGSSHNQWKILVLDAAARSILSPLLSVQQLRRRGVTLHLVLDSEREPIPDVPVIYFCMPTQQNLARIAQDCAKGLYERAHLNFVTKLERSLMEDFAKLVVQSHSLERIASVHDQYLDFVCMEQQLFSLHIENSYLTYNNPNTTESIIQEAMTQIAYGLFSVVATLGVVPIIRCPRQGAPEMVARTLNKMIAEHPTLLRSKSLSRPLLVILDRNADLITPVQHTSTYQALIDDLLQHKANRVEFQEEASNANKRGKAATKKYDLDPDQDPFYAQHKFQPFPEAIESNGSELQEVTVREQEIRQAGGGGTGLASAVDSLPALLERKKQLEVHTSILQAVMNQVASRDIPPFYELESKLATGGFKNDPAKAKKEVLALVTKGNVEDKVRLLMVYALATGAKTADLDEVATAIQESVPAEDRASRQQLESLLKALNYLKQLRSMQMIPAATDMLQELQSEAPGTSSTMLNSFLAKATTQATGLLAKATDKVASMLGKINKHHATVVVENLCEMTAGSEDDSYLYLDPKVKGDVDVNRLKTMSTRPQIRHVIAFVVGGGCYGEYQNLQMLSNDRRKVSYGSTEILDAGAFLQQLSQLG